MTTSPPKSYDLLYLRLLVGQIARDAQALHDAIPETGEDAPGFGDALAVLGEGIHQYALFWDGVALEERLEDIGPWGDGLLASGGDR